MKKSLVRGLTSTLALSIALAACTKTVDRGLKQDEQAKLDGIAAREAEVAKTKEEMAAKEAELNQRTADLQAQASELDSKKQRIEQEKTDFNSKLSQLESDKKQAEEDKARLAKESAALNEKQQRTEAEEKRLKENEKAQAELNAKIAQQKAELEAERAAIEAKGQQMTEQERKLQADVQNHNADVQAAQKMLQGEDGLSILLGKLVSGAPTQMLVMVLGADKCSIQGVAAIQAKVSALNTTPQDERIQTEKYQAAVCGARYLVTANSTQKLKELRDVAMKNNFLLAVYGVDKIRAQSYLTVETTAVGATTSESSAPIFVYNSGEIPLAGPMSRAALQSVSTWSRLPGECATVAPICLSKLPIESGAKSNLRGLFEASRSGIVAPSSLIPFAAKPKVVTGLKITHMVYVVGPMRSETNLSESMPDDFVSKELSTSIFHFTLPIVPEIKSVKLDASTEPNKLQNYLIKTQEYIDALK